MEIIIKRKTLLSALAGAKAAHPNEFICLLIGKREKGDLIIEETLIPPGIMVSESMSSFNDWMMPFVPGLVGTFHSHPGGSSRPSREDLWLFDQKGGAHFISGEPYLEKGVACYLGSGKKALFRVVD
jgi:proteasome lid subunit RPN8/RPN11